MPIGKVQSQPAAEISRPTLVKSSSADKPETQKEVKGNPGQQYDIRCENAHGKKSSFVAYRHGAGEPAMAAQYKAYGDLRKYAPNEMWTGIDDRMTAKLGIRPDAPGAQINIDTINDEVQGFMDAGLINYDDKAAIMDEIVKFSALYKEAFPNASDKDAFTLARDNARRIAYQASRDKEMFTGSDHGTKHILLGNMKLADDMIASLQANKVPVSAMDKVLIHQALIDHDLGYTTDEAGMSFNASKDHPLVSAAYVDSKGSYYDKYYPGKSQLLFETVLMHSYPRSDFESKKADVHVGTINSVVSTVDALGVAANNKSPLFFSEPDVVMTLGRLQTAFATGKADDAFVAKTRDELRTLLSHKHEIPRQMREGIETAIENNMTKVTGMFLLPQYGAKVNGIAVERGADRKLKPTVQLGVTKEHQALVGAFGPKLAFKNLGKALEDFQASDKKVKQLEVLYSKPYAELDKVQANIETPLAKFNLKFEDSKEPHLAGVFEGLREHSVRGEFEVAKERIKSLPDKMRPTDFMHSLGGTANMLRMNIGTSVPDIQSYGSDWADLKAFTDKLMTAGNKKEALAILENPPVFSFEEAFISEDVGAALRTPSEPVDPTRHV